MANEAYIWARRAGWFGVACALLASLGDLLLLYVPDGDYLAGDYLFYQDIGISRLLAGHYLGIIFIPLHLAGLWTVYTGLLPSGKRPAILALLLGLYAGFPGVAYHATCAYMAQAGASVDTFKLFSEPLAILFVLFFLALSLLFIRQVLRGATLFPRWMAWTNPLSIYILTFLAWWVWPAGGGILLVAGFNLSLAIFYFICLQNLKPH